MAFTLPLNGSGITFTIDHPNKDENGDHIQGRVLLFLSNNDKEEPRFQTNDKSSTAFVFGVDLKPQPSTKYQKAIISFKHFYINMKLLI